MLFEDTIQMNHLALMERGTGCTLGKIFYAWKGRNAWHLEHQVLHS